MKRVIVGIVIGIVLATTSTAVAATQSHWFKAARNIECTGGKSIMCYATNEANMNGGAYSVYLSDCSVVVYKDNSDGSDMYKVFEHWQPACR